MNQNPVRQHYVPKVYLKHFALDKSGNIYRLDIKSAHLNQSPKLSNVAKICIEDDSFKIETQELLDRYKLDDPYFIEKKVFDYENSLPRSIEKLTKKGIINLRDARKFITAILSIKRRNKAFRNVFHDPQIFNEIAKNNINSLKVNAELSQDEFTKKGIDILEVAERVETWIKLSIYNQ
ncbi:MAG: DUF4238 domain-containing protein [Saprospiraceae bacterium]|nr:DUF4238 domain-containing protein [Saprospiraceae bacterium]